MFNQLINLNEIYFREVTMDDVDGAAKLHIKHSKAKFSEAQKLFLNEFQACFQQPNKKTYYIATTKNQLIAFAGARHYETNTNENMYNTKKLLPAGWYLRGVHVDEKYRRMGLAKKLTELRLNWLSQKTNNCFVFLKEGKETIPMYKEFGFKIFSQDWEMNNSSKCGLLFHR